MSVLWCLLALAVPVAAAARGLELRGRIEPAPGRAVVAIHGALAPFSDQAFSDFKGRFLFRNLVPGSYTIAVFLPGYGALIAAVIAGILELFSPVDDNLVIPAGICMLLTFIPVLL